MADKVGIALLGCGSVGAEVARLILEEGCLLADRCGVDIELRHVLVRDPGKTRAGLIPTEILRDDPTEIWKDARTHIVIELIGGIDPARQWIQQAFAAGKDVVTANKALLAIHGPEITDAARRANRCITFEAAVCGGIPLIESIRRGLVANRITSVMGILNGTSNFVLTRMLENNATYAFALAEAQRLGYAEADPTLDVDGSDAAHKLIILASLALRVPCCLEHVSVRGITDVELRDLTAGAQLGYACKLLAVARMAPDGLALSVQPTFIPRVHPLASVGGAFNAVSVYGQPVGHILFYGRGAGGPATASAVIADVVDLAIGNAQRTFKHLTPALINRVRFQPSGATCSPHYLRLRLADQPGGIGKIATLLGSHGINIATIVQHEPVMENAVGTFVEEGVPVIVTTHPCSEKTMGNAISELVNLDVVLVPPAWIPVLDGAA